MSVSKQMKQAQTEEGKRLNKYRIHFGERWDAIMDERSRQAHSSFIKRFFAKKREEAE